MIGIYLSILKKLGIPMPAASHSRFLYNLNEEPTRSIKVVSKTRLRRTTLSREWVIFKYIHKKNSQSWSYKTLREVLLGGICIKHAPRNSGKWLTNEAGT